MDSNIWTDVPKNDTGTQRGSEREQRETKVEEKRKTAEQEEKYKLNSRAELRVLFESVLRSLKRKNSLVFIKNVKMIEKYFFCSPVNHLRSQNLN